MRQAVVIIHSIGEQLPMSTLRGFVEAVVKHSREALRLKRLSTINKRLEIGKQHR